MIIECPDGKQVDTRQLSPAERHVIQKLLAWCSLSDSLDFFRKKTVSALETGWNDSGPVRRTRILDQVILSLEKKVIRRLN